MPRVREFDPEQALEKAIELFWHKGYAETSTRDLVAYTGVAHAGLYSAFGSKRKIFRAALVQYRDRIKTQLLNQAQKIPSGRMLIEQFFETMLEAVRTGNYQDGCFMVNTGIEFGDEAGDILDIVNEHMNGLIEIFEDALTRAKSQDEVRTDLDPKATAEFLVTVFNGMAVFARSHSPYARIERSIRLALKELD